MLQLALYQPQIPPNTGNCIRLAANLGATLHLIGPMGFDLDEKRVRRAGLDYKDMATVRVHEDFDTFCRSFDNTVCLEATSIEGSHAEKSGKSAPVRALRSVAERLVICTTKASKPHFEHRYTCDDILLFGSETSGLPPFIHELAGENRIRIPMVPESRSLNLSNSVAVIAYESVRQQHIAGMLSSPLV